MRALYKYPQRAFPYAELVAENRRRGTRRAGVRAGRHRRLRRRPLLRRRGRVRQGRSRPTSSSASRVTNRGPDAAPLHLLPTLWFRNTWSWGARGRCSRDHCCAPEPADAARSRPSTRDLGTYWLACAGDAPSCCSPRTKPTPRACGACPIARRTSRTASTTPSSTARRDAVNPDARGTKAAAHYALHRRAGRDRDRAAAPLAADALKQPVRRRRQTSSRRASAEADAFYATGFGAERLSRRRAPRPAPGVRRAALEQAVLPLRRRAVAGRRSGRTRRRPRAQARPQRRLAAPQQRRRHLDARHVGVPLVRRLGPGLPLHPAGAWSIPSSPSDQLHADAARVVHAPQRPAAGLRVGVRRRQPAGARLGGLARLQDRAARRPAWPTATFWSASSTSCC